MWIRHQGAWRKGSIHCWFVHDGTWMAWMQHQPPDPDAPQAIWGLYVYDGVSIRQRYHPAAAATVDVPTAWGPQRTIQTRIRNLGYAVVLQKTGDEEDILLLG